MNKILRRNWFSYPWIFSILAIFLTFSSASATTPSANSVTLHSLIKPAEQSGDYSSIQAWVKANPHRCPGEFEQLLMGYLSMKSSKQLPKKTKAKDTLTIIADAA